LFRYVAVECILTFVSLQLGRSVDDYAGNLYMSSSTDTTSCISLVRLSSDHGGELAANKGRLSGRVGRTPASRRLQRAQLCAAPRRLSNNARQPLDPPPTRFNPQTIDAQSVARLVPNNITQYRHRTYVPSGILQRILIR